MNCIVRCWTRYTDRLQDINPDQVCIHPYNLCDSGLSLCCLILICFEQAEEMFDVASRYLLFPLKRAVADVLLPHLEMVSLDEHCHWLILADMYCFSADLPPFYSNAYQYNCFIDICMKGRMGSTKHELQHRHKHSCTINI